MRFSRIRNLFQRQSMTYRQPRSARRGSTVRLALEALEERIVPTFIQSALAAPPNIVAVADFNHDGHADAVSVNLPGTVSVALGNGNNTFQSSSTYTAGTVSSQALVADVNGDGKLDLIVLDANMVTFLGNGDGTFQPAVQSAVNLSRQLAVGDVNGDGKPDLVGFNLQIDSFSGALLSSSLQVYLGNGDGTFNAATSSALDSRPHAIALGDLNGDGKLDVAVANQSWSPSVPVDNVPTILTSSVSVLQGNGNGTFQAPVNHVTDSVSLMLPGGAVPHFTDAGGVAIGDFNGDGRNDLTVVNNMDIPEYQIVAGTGVPIKPGGILFTGFLPVAGSVSMLLGNADGTLQAPRNSATGTSPDTLTVADFNGDARPDLAIGAHAGVNVLLANGDGTFQLPVAFRGAMPPTTGGAAHTAMVVGDFNDDGRPDIATHDGYILTGHGDGSFQAISVGEVGSGPLGQVVGDFNGDGVPDLAVANDTDATVSVFLASHGALAAAEVIPVSYPLQFVADGMALGDFNGDGRLDLAVANRMSSGPGMVAILLGNGDGTFQAPAFYGAPGQYAQMVTVAGNELLLRRFGDGTVSVLISNGDGTFRSAPDIVLGVNPPAGTTGAPSAVQSLAAGDFNGDGTVDFVATTLGGSLISSSTGLTDPRLGFDKHVKVVLNDGTAQGQVTILDAGLDPSTVTTGDFNGDGKLDIAVYTHISMLDQGSIDVFLGNGDGTFRAPINSGPGVQSPFGGDVTNINGTNNILGGALTYNEMPLPTVPALGDLNGDGNIDLVMENPWGVGVRFGRGDGTFYPETQATTGPINAVINAAVADFNGDGHPDIAQMTYGFNAPGTATLLMNARDDQQVLDSVRAGAVGFKVSAPATAAEGQPFSVTVSAVDGTGNPVPGFRGTVFLRSSDPTWTGRVFGTVAPFLHASQAPYEYTFTAADSGTHTFTYGMTLSTDGNQTISAGVPFMAEGSATVTVGPAHLVVTPTSTGAIAGTPLGPVTVSVLDAAGNVVTGYTGPVTITSSDPQMKPVTYNFLPADGGTHTFASAGTLFTAGIQALTFTGTAMTPVARGVTVSPSAVAGRFVLSTPPTAIAGVPFNFTVKVFDAYGNFAPGATPTVSFFNFYLPPGGGSTFGPLPIAPYTFTAADQGIHVFTATLTSAGTNSITAQATTAVGGSPNIQVSAGAAAAFVIGAPVRLTTAGSAVSFSVTAYDAFGNLALGYAGKLHFTTTDPQVVLPDATAVVDNSYVVTFKTAGQQFVTITDTANPSLTSTTPSFTVQAAAPASIVLAGIPATTAGVAQTFQVVAKDIYGNYAPGYFGTVHFTSTDPQAALPADGSFGGGSVSFFTVTFKTAGVQSITIADPFNATFTSTETGIVVSPGATATFAVSGFPATTAGVAQSFTVTARDACGNLTSGYTGTVTFSSSDVQAGLPTSYTFTAADAGMHTFTATLKTAGSQSITVQDAANAAVLGSEAGIAVTAAVATQFQIVVPTTVTQGVGFTFTVKVLDAYGNVATGYRGKVHISSTDPKAGTSDYTFSSSDNGVHTFSYTLNTLGLQTITVTDSTNSSIRASAVVNVVAKTSGGGGTSGGGTSGGGTSGGTSGGGGGG